MTMAPKSNVPHVMPPIIPRNSLILVGDGQKALFLRNRGSAQRIDLVVERILEQENPATREQGTDRPGRSIASVGLGKLRKAFHPEVLERIAAEIPKELTSHPVSEIGKLIAA